MTLDDPTPVALTRAEALVLFDWLHQLEEVEDRVTQDKATQVALWALSASLESALVEPLQPDYDDVLSRARAHLADDDSALP
jgi:hypothetical protein